MLFSSSSSTLRSFFSSNGSSKLDYSKKICGEFDKLNLNKNEIQTSIDDMVSWIQILLGKASQPKEYSQYQHRRLGLTASMHPKVRWAVQGKARPSESVSEPVHLTAKLREVDCRPSSKLPSSHRRTEQS
ncbi:uncharacterized protein VDAG_06205 [Verticillium dahliae VdLs.17]|uniref:Uncharacterized protein n=1 Tax=Verticillium dahliae (strain VdLs.17 / ATCC MYA-4575 / FGSC 10137) TaxID=498257 RepID=G2X8R4_VERDV|nr:uncharacterized protein VDAG_06205 [Verticillium dahliae VdLs.17]EGY15351.1 hypothetical protein VDAG_06205 [Verticillium dahliae VdLs.17]KAH6698004.1 hypothetical protein EV126DRAFT_443844 [Verticillium dahliae]